MTGRNVSDGGPQTHVSYVPRRPSVLLQSFVDSYLDDSLPAVPVATLLIRLWST
jgi:hypothetical protein